jgi:hypothetical protein
MKAVAVEILNSDLNASSRRRSCFLMNALNKFDTEASLEFVEHMESFVTSPARYAAEKHAELQCKLNKRRAAEWCLAGELEGEGELIAISPLGQDEVEIGTAEPVRTDQRLSIRGSGIPLLLTSV